MLNIWMMEIWGLIMNIDYNKYLNFYNDYKEKFSAAKTSVESYPCSELVKQIDSMINFLSFKKDISWEGSARAEFDDSINKCLDNLNAIKDSVNSVWKRAETIYKEIDSSLSDLYDNYITLVGVIKNGKPVVEDYEKIVKNADGTISVTTPGYNAAYTRCSGY